jgi:hypothetical protein
LILSYHYDIKWFGKRWQIHVRSMKSITSLVICCLSRLSTVMGDLLFSFRAHAFFNLGPYAAFQGMTLTCHIDGSMITAISTHLRVFLNFTIFMFKCWILLKPVLGGRGRSLALSSTIHEQAQSNRACNIFNFIVLGVL